MDIFLENFTDCNCWYTNENMYLFYFVGYREKEVLLFSKNELKQNEFILKVNDGKYKY